MHRKRKKSTAICCEPELLLQLANDSALDSVEILQLAERHEDDDSLAATIKLELLGSRNKRAVQVGLQLRGGRL